jgi:hypothetical protein
LEWIVSVVLMLLATLTFKVGCFVVRLGVWTSGSGKIFHFFTQHE